MVINDLMTMIKKLSVKFLRVGIGHLIYIYIKQVMFISIKLLKNYLTIYYYVWGKNIASKTKKWG